MRWNQDLFKRTLDFAARAHGAQQVPGSKAPYVVHLVKVATELLTLSQTAFDVDLAMTCALLHDTMEDAGVTFAEVEAAFGRPVAEGVSALTKNEALPKAERMADSLSRIRAQPKEIWLVKLADRITNLEPPPAHWPAPKRQAYFEEAAQILEGLRGASAELEARFEAKRIDYQSFISVP
jgi:guanosine-3',5'-bis(diphosphate) 3'-pyrophosphohydrolase